MNRLFPVAIAMLPMLAVAPSGATASAVPSFAELAGHTVITARGLTGITLNVPRDVLVPAGSVRYELLEGEFAFVGMNWSTWACPPNCLTDEFIFERTWIHHAPVERILAGAGSIEGTSDPPRIDAGPLDVYVLTDGAVRVTIDGPELDGTAEYEATGRLDGSLLRLPRTCFEIVPECERFGFGGAARSVRGPAIAGVHGYSVIEGHVASPYGSVAGGEIPLEVCVYPSPDAPDASSDPEDHPLGCDFVSVNEFDDVQSIEVGVSGPATCICTANMTSYWTKRSDGPVYGGYVAANHSFVGGHSYGAWAMWLNRGIACDSGDFRNC